MCVRQSRSDTIRFIYREPRPSLWDWLTEAICDLSVAVGAGLVVAGFWGIVIFVILRAWAQVA